MVRRADSGLRSAGRSERPADLLRSDSCRAAGTAVLLEKLAHARRPTPLDPRITRAAASIDRLIPMGSVRLAAVAEESRLSLGRFRHLFAAEIGMPFQRFVLWRRLIIAFDELGMRRSATEGRTHGRVQRQRAFRPHDQGDVRYPGKRPFHRIIASPFKPVRDRAW